MVSSVDEAVGNIVETLEATGANQGQGIGNGEWKGNRNYGSIVKRQ